VSPAAATFPGRNGPIAYSEYGANATEDGADATTGLAVQRSSRSQERRLLECFAPGGDFEAAGCTISGFSSPSYSPDGSKIVFDAGERLAVVDADGSHLQLFQPASADDDAPAFSANGRRIVFTGHDAHGVPSVYERLVDGAPARLLVPNASEPVVSSRKRLAFVRDGAVYVADREGVHARRVSAGAWPDWSPGGGRLVIVRPVRPLAPQAFVLGALYTVRADGSHLRRVGKVRDAWAPAWSPDGRLIAYNREEDGIFIRSLARGKPHVFAESQYGETGTTSATTPGWRPLPR
jgi:Tol biopolymer transport system component